MDKPVLYVIAGPNGVGKTTGCFDILPAKIPIINSDEIAAVTKQSGIVNANMQECSNREAIRLMNEHLIKQTSFAIETNLADVNTWKFLLEVQKQGYAIEVAFFCVENINTLNSRIAERVRRGEHYVRPDIVEERYVAGLNLLSHYFNKPDYLKLIDNSSAIKIVAEIRSGIIKRTNSTLPVWVETYLGKHFAPTENTQPPTNQLNIEEVRKKYEGLRNKPEKRNG